MEREGALTVIAINRPEVMNALHPPAQQELCAAFDAFAGDPSQWVAILTGAGDRAIGTKRAMFESADYLEGPRAFAEKRKPRWQGL
jgi:enoyl-CoA hydratase/carnithine racemase